MTAVWGLQRASDPTPDLPESPAERAAHAVLLAVADFHVAIRHARTVGDALKLRAVIAEALASVESAERAALERADQLCN